MTQYRFTHWTIPVGSGTSLGALALAHPSRMFPMDQRQCACAMGNYSIGQGQRLCFQNSLGHSKNVEPSSKWAVLRIFPALYQKLCWVASAACYELCKGCCP